MAPLGMGDGSLDRALSFPEVLEDELAAMGAEGERRQLAGLAFSGGGIRSATFNLGVLQGLARLGLLRRFHYLSTVSGGGYIGCWLAAWCRRQGVEAVEAALGEGAGADRMNAEPHPVKLLRENSNYLTPHLGLFSLDTWTLITTYLRNLLLNQAVLLASLATVLVSPYLLLSVQQDVFLRWPKQTAFVGLLAALVAVVKGSREMASMRRLQATRPATTGHVVVWVVAPLLLAAWLVSPWLLPDALRPPADVVEVLMGVLACAALYAVGVGLGTWRVRSRAAEGRPAMWKGARLMLWAAVAAVAGGLMLIGILGPVARLERGSVLPTFLGPAALVAVALLTGFVHTGLARGDLLDEQREWRSRLAAALLLWTGILTLVPLLSLLGPPLLEWMAWRVGRWLNAGMLLAWAGSTLSGVLLGRHPSTGPGSRRPALDMAARAAPVVFVVGLLLLLASGLPPLLETAGRWAGMPARRLGDSFPTTGTLPPTLARFVTEHLSRVEAVTAVSWVVFAVLALAALGLSARVGINEFSLHAMYRNRLVRCYLGASNAERHDGSFTGFDPRDDLPLADLDSPERKGPLLIVNTCLNLVRGRRLAWQTRKGASFTLTPRRCGWEGGYCPSREYGGGLSLGTAMAISGAAASPNMGYHSSAPLAFLMTVFNVRLGMWLGNSARPARPAWKRPGPRVGFLYLLCELVGLADDDRDFVYLSDGGHFDNLGLYELVRRRCRFIVVSDAGQDARMQFGDLGNAVEKCRTDLGAEVEIDVQSLRADTSTRLSPRHCAVGRIRYADGSLGTLLYLKSSMTGDEPTDVARYAAAEPAFPQQTTADQFFDESQFESYRALGAHVLESALGPLGDRAFLEALSLEELFLRLRRLWYPPSLKVSERFTLHAAAVDRIFTVMRTTPELRFLDAQIYPEWAELQPKERRLLWLPEAPEEVRAGFYTCNQLIQLMENVYLDLDLEREAAHPDNRGWMNVFRRWSGSGMLRVTWAVCCGTYGARFQTFCERQLGMGPGDVDLGPPDAVPGHVNEAWLGTVAWLNPFERRLLGEVFQRLATPPGGGVEGCRLAPLRLAVRDPLEPPGAPAKQYFTLGFVLLRPSVENGAAIRYLRVQNHVRAMGLGRKVLEAVLRAFPGPVSLDPIPPEAWPRSEPSSDEERRQFDGLFESVLAEHAARGSSPPARTS